MDIARGRAACPPDYALLRRCWPPPPALIGHALGTGHTQAEPPHYGSVPAIAAPARARGRTVFGRGAARNERECDFPDRLREGREDRTWENRDAKVAMQHAGLTARTRSAASGTFPRAEPQALRLRQNDVTIEKVAELLAVARQKAADVRDELAG